MARERLTREQVEHVARLARLELEAGEAEEYRQQLERVLEHMAELDAVSVDGVEATFHPAAAVAPLRDDEVGPSLSHDEALANAPRASEGGFAVPRVLEEGGGVPSEARRGPRYERKDRS